MINHTENTSCRGFLGSAGVSVVFFLYGEVDCVCVGIRTRTKSRRAKHHAYRFVRPPPLTSCTPRDAFADGESWVGIGRKRKRGGGGFHALFAFHFQFHGLRACAVFTFGRLVGNFGKLFNFVYTEFVFVYLSG